MNMLFFGRATLQYGFMVRLERKELDQALPGAGIERY